MRAGITAFMIEAYQPEPDTMTKYQAADRSIASYDAFIFSAVGRPFDANKADTLAAIAAVDCEEAARDRTVNQFTRDQYRNQAVEFRAICA